MQKDTKLFSIDFPNPRFLKEAAMKKAARQRAAGQLTLDSLLQNPFLGFVGSLVEVAAKTAEATCECTCDRCNRDAHRRHCGNAGSGCGLTRGSSE